MTNKLRNAIEVFVEEALKSISNVSNINDLNRFFAIVDILVESGEDSISETKDYLSKEINVDEFANAELLKSYIFDRLDILVGYGKYKLKE